MTPAFEEQDERKETTFSVAREARQSASRGKGALEQQVTHKVELRGDRVTFSSYRDAVYCAMY